MQSYELQGPIGQGQFGTVYKAKHRGDGQCYCIKRIPNLASAKEDQTATLKEAQLLSSLSHPNIIKYKECFIDDEGALCIVTSFCEEGDLFRRIREKSKANELFGENEIMDMFIQIASSLMYIHGKKVLHRDLKTQNIFIARGGIMVLGDFGISKVLEKTDQFATTVTGTPYYMAPEICSSQPYTYKSDIWSLGCVLYELCTLKHAFAADSLLSLVYQIVRGNFPPIPTDKFSTGLSDLVNSLLVRDPNCRPVLQQVFLMPYVKQHLARYKQEEERRYIKQSTMTKRKQMLEDTAQQTANLSLGADFRALTPKQQMARRREVQQQKRELELKVATMNVAQDRRQVEERKNKMVHESNVGLPGNRMRASVSSSRDEEDMGYAMRQRGTTSSLDESLVNFGTLPSSSYEGTSGRGATGAGDTVLMGSVIAGGGLASHAGRKAVGSPGPGQSQGQGPGLGTSTGRFGGTGSSVNMASVNLRSSATGASAGGSRPSPGLDTNGVRSSRPSVPRVEHGFRFGTPVSGVRDSQAAAATQSLPQSPATPHFERPELPMMRNRMVESMPSADVYDDDDGGHEYDDDFEDYLGDDDGQKMVNHRMKLLNNVQELERTVLSAQPGQIVTVEEKVNSAVKSNKAQALRDRCVASLGPSFEDVYGYLRRVRSAAQPVSENEVQRRLLELVGNKKELMQGCFMVDQMVFQEATWAPKK